jgi:hypothetical protein
MRCLCTTGNAFQHTLPAILLTSFVSLTASSQDLDNRIAQQRVGERQLLPPGSANETLIRNIRETFVRDQMDAARAELETKEVDLGEADRNFVAQVPKFRKVIVEYRDAVAVEGSPARPLRELHRLVDAFITYFKQTHTACPETDPSEFKDLTKTDLLEQALLIADHVDSELPQAAMLVKKAMASNTVTIQSMLFLRNLHGEFRRLELLLSKLK